MSGLTAIVSIGRGNDSDPEATLSASVWRTFIAETNQAVRGVAREIHAEPYAHQAYGRMTQYGRWIDEATGREYREQCAHWVFTVDTDRLNTLRSHLRNIVADYGQDAIALTLGVTEFLTPETSEPF